MKTFYTLSFTLLIAISSFAQTVNRLEKLNSFRQTKTASATNKSVNATNFSEDFESGDMPSNFTILNEDGNSLPPTDMPVLTEAWVVITDETPDINTSCAFSSSYEATGNADDWMITPMISITNGTFLQWNSMIIFGFGTTQDYEVLVTTSIVGSVPTASDFTDTPVYTGTQSASSWEVNSVDLETAGYSNTDIWVAFRNTSLGTNDPYEVDILLIDNILVNNPGGIDAEISSINLPFINGFNLDITGTIKNVGVDNITSYDVSYNIDGGTESAVYNVSGVNLNMNETHDFTHNLQHVFSAVGDYAIEVTISNINGTSDSDVSNNSLSKNITIGEDMGINRRVLFEYFGANDQPLGGGMFDIYATGQNTFNTEIVDNPDNWSKSTFISHEMDPDPYEIQDCIDRHSYYGITSQPGRKTNGIDGTGSDLYNIDVLYQDAAFMDIDATYTLDGNNIDVLVSIDPHATINATCQVAIVEKITTGNLGTCEATAYYNVLMKMLPDANGSPVSLTNGTTESINLSYDLTTSFVEDISDLEVIVFIQDNTTKYVYQSNYANFTTVGIDNQSKVSVKLYPNPCNEVLNIETTTPSLVSISDITGKNIFLSETYEASFAFDTSELPKGTYIIKVESKDKVEIQKIVVGQ